MSLLVVVGQISMQWSSQTLFFFLAVGFFIIKNMKLAKSSRLRVQESSMFHILLKLLTMYICIKREDMFVTLPVALDVYIAHRNTNKEKHCILWKTWLSTRNNDLKIYTVICSHANSSILLLILHSFYRSVHNNLPCYFQFIPVIFLKYLALAYLHHNKIFHSHIIHKQHMYVSARLQKN